MRKYCFRILHKKQKKFIIEFLQNVEYSNRKNPWKEAREMDVRFPINTPYSLPGSHPNADRATKPVPASMEFPYIVGKNSDVSDEVREQVIMNLQEMQNFLYMLIGSKLRIHTDKNSLGLSVNTAV